MRRRPSGPASVESLPSATWLVRAHLPRKATASVPDDAALAGKARARDITNAQIVQSIIQRGIE
ncbi:MAG: hypothetical protein OXE96_09185 [Gemmatimonadetes bacterium]|nr:hypothetical protein [Gemmatimonadota bacterium]